MHVTAIVVAWNAAEDLPGCLAALQAQDHPDLEVVVVDNASSDGTAQVLDAASVLPGRHPLRVLSSPTNRGFCGGVNHALAQLGDEVEAVLLVNPDARCAPDLLRRAVAVLAARPQVGTVQPRLTRPTTGSTGPVLDTTGHVLTTARLVDNRGEGQPDDGRYRDPGEVFGASGALVLHRRAMLDDIAWHRADGSLEHLTEDLFAYFDDVELDWRAQLHGWHAWYEPTATGVHERGGAGPRRTPRVEALNHTNRLLVLVTCDSGRSLARHGPLVAVTSLLKAAELTLTVPSALPEAIARFRLLPAAWRRRRQLKERARVPFVAVTTRWLVPFRWRPWIATWWTRRSGASGSKS